MSEGRLKRFLGNDNRYGRELGCGRKRALQDLSLFQKARRKILILPNKMRGKGRKRPPPTITIRCLVNEIILLKFFQ